VASYYRFNEAQVKLEENAKFAAFNRMSAFVVHDLKNVIAQIGMIVSNGEKYRHIPEFIDDTFETLEHTKERMDRMLSQLKEKQQQRSLLVEIELNQILKELTEEYARAKPVPQFVGLSKEVHLEADDERFRSVIGHLIDNAQHATDDDGEVTVKIMETDTHIKLSISDTGIGMSDDFINNQLFKPFETTKGNAGMGVGVYEAKTFAEEFGGTLTVNSQLSTGSTFTMTLPTRKGHG
jgi:putative PEP-CTERM system histidine kinase